MASVVVIVLARKRRIVITFVLVAVVATGLMLAMRRSLTQLVVGQHVFSTELFKSQSEQQRGLSGRSGLADDHAALFVFSDEQQRCFWMKDMQFAIDMVWLNASKQIVAIEHRVAPSTYPKQFCHQARYVVEWSAGTALGLGLEPGLSVVFTE